MQVLTERQQAVLEFVVRHIRENQFPPTVREIGLGLGIRSTNGVSDHLKALERKGYLEKRGMKSRGLVPTAAAMEALGWEGAEPEAAVPSRIQEQESTLAIPVLGRVAAGQPILAEESWDAVVRVDRGFLGSKEGPTFALRVTGDSMIGDGIHEGDLVVVRQQATARSGEIVVVRIENEATVKRYFPEGDRIRLQPSNPRLSPMYVEKGSARDVQILGVVVGLLRSFVGA